MHFVSRPLGIVFLTAIFVYAITLPILTVQWTSRAADVTVSVLWLLSTFAFLILSVDFVLDFFQERMTIRDSVWGFVNLIFTAWHILALFGMAIWLLDKSTFPIIADSSNRYNIYYSYFLTTSSDFILQTGFRTVVPAPGNAAGATFGVLGGLFGFLFIVVLFTLVARPLQRAAQRNRL